MAQTDYKMSTRSFVNPYNFIPINQKEYEKKKIENSSREEKILRSGYLNCRLYVKTPLAIPDALKKEEVNNCKDHFYYPYYTVNGKTPIIPGSSIRGSVRSLYEALTDSCMITSKETDAFTARTSADAAYTPGLLIKNGKGDWELFRADRFPVPMEGDGYTIKNNCPQYFRIIERNGERFLADDAQKEFEFAEQVNFEKSTGKIPYVTNIEKIGSKTSLITKDKGYLFIGEENSQEKDGVTVAGSKSQESIFVRKKNGKAIRVYSQEELTNELLAIKKDYNDPAKNKMLEIGHSGYAGFNRRMKTASVLPIWYSKMNDAIYLSYAAIGRFGYKNSMYNMIKNRRPCTERILCPACELFGNAAKDYAYGSKIRITDAEAIIGKWSIIPKISLKELGGPHPTYLPFYAIDNKDYDLNEGEIRGRKFYWHNMEAASSSKPYHDSNITKRNSTMDLIKTGSEFVFKIYYDGITIEQLEKLIWVVNFWENDSKGSFGQKLGHGKPIGLGSVKITIENRIERQVKDGCFQWTQVNWNQDLENIVCEDGEIEKRLKRMATFDAQEGKTISYGFIEGNENHSPDNNDYAGHQWYTNNRGTGKESKGKTQILPDVLDNQELKAFRFIKK